MPPGSTEEAIDQGDVGVVGGGAGILPGAEEIGTATTGAAPPTAAATAATATTEPPLIVEGSITPFLANLKFPELAEPVQLQLLPTDCVHDVRQWLLDIHECAHYTCYYVAFNGTRINDVAEFGSIEGLGNGATLDVVHDKYNDRAVRIHTRRLRELIFPTVPGSNQVQATTDVSSPSYFAEILRVAKEEPTLVPEQIRADAADKGAASGASRSFELKLGEAYMRPTAGDTDPNNACLQSLTWSGWSPPPGPCMLQGDILYIRVVTLEVEVFHVSACTSGFFVNRTTDQSFDRREHPTRPCHSAMLSDLLSQLSAGFKAGFTALQTASETRHPFESLPTPHKMTSWLAHPELHRYDEVRAEDSNAIWSEADHHNPGMLRDWNDELQALRELPRETMAARSLRLRSLYKFNCDYVATVFRGAQAVVLGNVPPMNPLDEKDSHMFTWNNIFFSFATDSRGIFKELGGDPAARAAAGNDLRGVRAYSTLELPDLYTLATVVVDYLGHRVVAQSIVPGILRRNQTCSVVYGASEIEGKMVVSDRFNDLLAKSMDKLHIKSHSITYSDDPTEHKINSSAECKGILGTDERFYVLDLIRTTPIDTNFAHPEHRDEHDAEVALHDLCRGKAPAAPTEEPWAPRHKLFLIRPELIELYSEHRMMEAARKSVADRRAAAAAAGTAASIGAGGTDTAAAAGTAAAVTTAANPTTNGGAENEADAAVAQPQPSGASASASTAEPKAGESKFVGPPRMVFNPDVYTSTKLAMSPEAIQADRADVRQLAQFLSRRQVPKVATDLLAQRITPFDGTALRDAMHAHGINMRYLGQIVATMMRADRPSLPFAVTLCVTELLARCAKHLLRQELHGAEVAHLAATVSHFLNCLVGAPQPGGGSSAAATGGGRDGGGTGHAPAKSAKRRGKKGSSSAGDANQKGGNGGPSKGGFASRASKFVPKLTPASLWKRMADEARVHFCSTISGTVLDDFNVSKLALLRSVCQKTGIQLLAKDYKFEGANQTVVPSDIVCIHPTVKNTPPTFIEGHALECAATAQFQAGNLRQSHELADQAIDMYHQVYGPMHASVAKCNKLLGLIMLQSDNLEAAIGLQEKATLITERVCGRDHSDTINNYMHLGQYYYAARHVAKALATIHHARNMCLTTFGSQHPELPSIDIQMARGLMDFKDFEGALTLLTEALGVQRSIAGVGTLLEGHIFLLSATAKRDLSDYRGAVQSVKQAHDIYVKEFGEQDHRSLESLATYKMYAGEAVRAARLRKLTDAATALKKKGGGKAPSSGAGAGVNASGGGGGGGRGAKSKGRTRAAKKQRTKAKVHPAASNGRPGQQSIDEVMSFINGSGN